MFHLFSVTAVGIDDGFFKEYPVGACLINPILQHKKRKTLIIFIARYRLVQFNQVSVDILRMAGEEDNSLESTPTWSIATVCGVFIITSLGLQQGLHYLGKSLKKNNRRSLYEALQKLKEELMLLGFISLLLTVFNYPIGHICISRSLTRVMLPCRKKESENSVSSSPEISETPSEAQGYCEAKGKEPLLSIEGMHQLHMFVFVLAIVHVVYCAMTMILGAAKIHSWKRWEAEIKENLMSENGAAQKRLTDVTHDDFIMSHTHTNGHCMKSETLDWIESFWRQFYGSVKRSDYTTLRLGFIEEHCRTNKNFDFHSYLVRCLEVDFKKVVGISGYHWAFVVIFLLLNNHGWNTYFWMAFLPIFLLLSVGTKLQHVIKRMAQEVIEKNNADQGENIVRLSNEYFWFGRPQLILHLIHFILFQNAFELAFVLWITVNFGFTSCMLSKVSYMIPRVFMGVLVQVLCSYSTFPLYALVTQMGYTFKRSIFEEHIQQSIIGWCKKSKKKNRARFSKEQANGNDNLQQRKPRSSKRVKILHFISEKQKSAAIAIQIDRS